MSFSTKLNQRRSSTKIPRILVVEDDSTSRLLLHDYLNHLGYEVFSILSGAEFFGAIEQFQPHLILLDLKLPQIDGYTLLEQLRQNQNYDRLPVIVISAYAFRADQQRAFALGANEYLVKPIDLNALKQILAERTLSVLA
jgi:two-component system, cell cycle response regulator DivK